MNTVISMNFNSWKPITTIKYSTKITHFARFVREHYGESEPTCIAIQEFITGGGKYLDELYKAFGGKYYILTPPSFDYRVHNRSIVSLVLLNKSTVEKYEVINFGHCLPNRILYAMANINGKSWRIMNCYQVQTANFTGRADWYIAQRKELRKVLWKETMEELSRQKDSRMIVLGDFQESSESAHIMELKKMGYQEAAAGFPTVKNDFFEEKNINHIFFSAEAWKSFRPTGLALDSGLMDKVSDHCLLAVMSE